MSKPWTIAVSQPATTLSANVTAFGFGDRLHRRVAARLNVRGHGINARVKTHRDSRGVVWQGKPFYWTIKGYYRGGSQGFRQPLQWLVWEDATGRTVPRGSVVVFLDGDRHNFHPANLALRTKQEIVAANSRTGSHKLTFERRSQIRGEYFARRARALTGLLLGKHQAKENNDILTNIASARRTERHRNLKPR